MIVFLFPDPIFPLGFLVNSWVPGMLDAVFQVCLLILVTVLFRTTARVLCLGRPLTSVFLVVEKHS